MSNINNLPLPSHSDNEDDYDIENTIINKKKINKSDIKISNISESRINNDFNEIIKIQETNEFHKQKCSYIELNRINQNELISDMSQQFKQQSAKEIQFLTKMQDRINNIYYDEFEDEEIQDRKKIQNKFSKKELNSQQIKNSMNKKNQEKYMNESKKQKIKENINQNNHSDKVFRQPKDILTKDLTYSESENLLENWKKCQFYQFNTWLQLSKSTLKQDYTPHQYGFVENRKGQIEGFGCKLTLKINQFKHGERQDYISVGFGRKKQDAKQMALERLCIELIQTGTIKKGLKDQNKLNNQLFSKPKENFYIKQVQKPNPSSEFEEKILEFNYKRAKRLSKMIQENLKNDNLQESLQCLKDIAQFKILEWNEVSYIWAYGVINQNSKLLQQILEIVKMKSIQETQQNNNQNNQISIEQNGNKNEEQLFHENQVQQKLFFKYGIIRQKVSNPHDIYDSASIDYNEKEICKGQIEIKNQFRNNLYSLALPYNNNVFNEELVRNHFMKDIKDRPVPIKNNENFIQDSTFKTFQELTENKLLIPIDQNDKYETQFDEDDILYKSKDELQMKQFNDNNLSILNQKQIDDQIVDKQNSIKRENCIQAILLDEMYETLIYSGDKAFSLEIAEKIYSQLQLDTNGFVQESAADYYAQKKNLIITEVIDIMYESLLNTNPIEQTCNINGKIQQIGTDHNYDIISVVSLENYETLYQKLLKKYQFDSRESQNMIVEGDIVILTTFFRPSYDKPVLIGTSSKLAEFIIQRAKSQKDNRDFIHNITEFGNVIEYALIGTVLEIKKDYKIKIKISPTFDQSKNIYQDSSRQWKITKLLPRTYYERISESLRLFCFNSDAAHPVISQIIFKPPGISSHIINTLSIEKHKERREKIILNPEQKLAVEKATKNRISLIQGPPGSGKTTTAIEIVLEWLSHSKESILVTAESQEKINIIYKELIKADIKAVLIGQEFGAQLDNQIENISKPEGSNHFSLITEEETKIQSKKFMMLKQTVREAHVVCCTCLTVMTDYLKRIYFSRVIINEANSVSELLAIIPIHKFCSQLVLIGDQMQIQPKSVSMFAQSKGMCLSLYQKFITQGFKPHILKTQYKVSENQMIFQSKYFYNNILENDICQESKLELKGFLWPNPKIQTCIISVKGFEQETIFVDQLQNPKEAEVVVEVLNQIMRAGYIKLSQIGIITTFEEQKRRIRSQINTQAKFQPSMAKFNLEDSLRITQHSTLVDIETIDKSEMKDKDLIIFSPVRSNSQKLIGILKDPRILNTILWKGKHGFIMICDIETISQESHWNEYFKWAKQNNLIINYSG